MKSSVLRVFLLLAMIAGLIVIGCSDDKSDTKVVITDSQLEAALATLMRQSNTMLDSVFTGDLEPSDYDFRPLHAVFVGYLAEHPGHKRASFGAALSSMMILTTNSELNRLFDSLIPDGSARFAPPTRLARPCVVRLRCRVISTASSFETTTCCGRLSRSSPRLPPCRFSSPKFRPPSRAKSCRR